MTDYTPHWSALLLPPMDAEAFGRLKSDIEDNGQIEPIVLWRNQIVDGRHRHRACTELGIEPNFDVLPEEMTEKEVFARALSKNVVRRHLSIGQRALIAHDLLHGEASGNLQSRMTISQAATLLGVSDSAVNMLTATLKRAPQVREEVLNGKLTVNAARDLAELAAEEPETAEELLEAVREAPTPKAAKKVASKATEGVRERKKKAPLGIKLSRKAKANAEPDDDPAWVAELIQALHALPAFLKKEPLGDEALERLVAAVDDALQVLNGVSYTHEEA